MSCWGQSVSEDSLTGHSCDKWSWKSKKKKCLWRSWLSVQRLGAHFDSCMKVGGLIKKRIKVFRPITSMYGGLLAANRLERGGDGPEWEAQAGLLVGGTFSCCYDGFSMSHCVVCQRLYIYPISKYQSEPPFLGLVRVNVISIPHQDIVD